MKNIGLIGVGWHARRIYVPWLRNNNRHRWVLGVDLCDKADEIHSALAPDWAPELLFSPTLAHEPVAPQILERLELLQAKGQLDTLLLSVDPIARKGWIEWALGRGFDLLVDKPLTAPFQAAHFADVAQSLQDDFDQIHEALRASKSRLWVQAQRRFHPGYKLIHSLLSEVTETFQVPVTHLDISHSDGMWVAPGEWDRVHHPYSHGWGKLMHSGYHFVDAAMWLLTADRSHQTKPRELRFHTLPVTASEHHHRLPYQLLSGAKQAPPPPKAYGEVDISFLGQVMAADRPRTTLVLQLLQSALSQRTSAAPPDDPYKGAGRIRHERVTVSVGPLLNVQIHSYQSHEVRDPVPMGAYGPGHIDHFDVHIYRNPLVKGPRYEMLALGRRAHPDDPGHNEKARIDLLEAFLAGETQGSCLIQHQVTYALLTAMYRSMATPGVVQSLLL